MKGFQGGQSRRGGRQGRVAVGYYDEVATHKSIHFLGSLRAGQF